MQQTKDKKVYFELMRIISIGLVIFNHLLGYMLFSISSGPKQWIYMFITMITRINIPLFFMISGALLLRKDEEFPKVLKTRIPRYLLVLLIFEGALFCCYKLSAVIQGNDFDFSLHRFVWGLFSRTLDGAESYWYLYSYLGMLLTLPFMQRIARAIKKDDIRILICLHFIFSSAIPILNILLTIAKIERIEITGFFSVPFATEKQFFYPILGFYLENYIDVKKFKAKHISGLLLVAFIAILLPCICTYWEGITTGKFTQEYVLLFDYATSIVAFLVIKYLMVCGLPKLSEGKVAQVICYIGSLTFGIYLLDPFFKLFFYSKFESMTEPLLPTLLVSVGWVLVSMILGGIVTAILKKIPGIKKLL